MLPDTVLKKPQGELGIKFFQMAHKFKRRVITKGMVERKTVTEELELSMIEDS